MHTSSYKKLLPLVIGSIGVVFGDIGTSPLYTIKSCFNDGYLHPDPVNILGIASLVFWALMLVVTVKYLIIIMSADNKGEGGIFALVALINRRSHGKRAFWVSLLGVFGAALLFGDGVITPAISVLGALEGLAVLSPRLGNAIVPVSVVLIFMLFMLQSKGTARIGRFYGPITIVWFVTIAALGIPAIVANPQILYALNPWYAFWVIKANGILSFHILGTIVLCITGVEALYADLGHFSKSSIRIAWFSLVAPCLLLNYFGQCALLLSNPDAIGNPFYMLVPEVMLAPMIILATVASVIASQAVITGIFSITRQAILLGYMPRMKVVHTSNHLQGQVYLPFVNFIIMIMTILSVLIFKSSDNLAFAYGLTITLIMSITSALTMYLAYKNWKWWFAKVLVVFVPFCCIDAVFVAANIVKVAEGAWYSLLIASVFAITMYIWFKGRNIMNQPNFTRQTIIDFAEHVNSLTRHRAPGTAVYLSRTPGFIPLSTQLNLQHNHAIHERVIFMSVIIRNIPKVSSRNRLNVTYFNGGIYQVKACYGFTEVPNIMKVFRKLRETGMDLQVSDVSFFLSRGIPTASALPLLSRWEEALFIFLFHNSASPTDFFKLPNNRVIEIGTRVLV